MHEKKAFSVVPKALPWRLNHVTICLLRHSGESLQNGRLELRRRHWHFKHLFFIFYFTKSETSDSFVSHFDGHFAYLKTLDFSLTLYTHHAYGPREVSGCISGSGGHAVTSLTPACVRRLTRQWRVCIATSRRLRKELLSQSNLSQLLGLNQIYLICK